jgi:hypothetical protein
MSSNVHVYYLIYIYIYRWWLRPSTVIHRTLTHSCVSSVVVKDHKRYQQYIYFWWHMSCLCHKCFVCCVCFIDRCLSFCTFSFGHCVVCSSSIYGFWLPLWYLQTLLIFIICSLVLFTSLGNSDRNHKLWNIVSAERYILHMQVLMECYYI